MKNGGPLRGPPVSIIEKIRGAETADRQCAGLKSGGASPPPHAHNDTRIETFPHPPDFRRIFGRGSG